MENARNKIDRMFQKDEVIFVTADEHKRPLKKENEWMRKLTIFKAPYGPRFPDNSINWECNCMAGGSLVAHRCGYFFRHFYVCISENNYEDATINCPNQFVDWSACMQNLSEERREQMRRAMVEDATERSKKQIDPKGK